MCGMQADIAEHKLLREQEEENTPYLERSVKTSSLGSTV